MMVQSYSSCSSYRSFILLFIRKKSFIFVSNSVDACELFGMRAGLYSDRPEDIIVELVVPCTVCDVSEKIIYFI
jgi:hypothetical protein